MIANIWFLIKIEGFDKNNGKKSQQVLNKRRSSRSVEKIIGGYVLRKPIIKQKTRILNSLMMAKKKEKGDILSVA